MASINEPNAEPGPSYFAQSQRHSEYYLDDGNITFLVENTLFRIHRHFLMRDSPIFRDMLSVPVPPDAAPEGYTDDNPIVLEQVRSADFAQLLWMFYNPTWNFTASVDHWCAILALADKWQMDVIRKFSIDKLSKLPVEPVVKISLSQKYDLDSSWALDAYTALCTRADPLSASDGQIIGVETFAKVAKARERIISARQKYELAGRQQTYESFGGGAFAGGGRGMWLEESPEKEYESIVRDVVVERAPAPLRKGRHNIARGGFLFRGGF